MADEKRAYFFVLLALVGVLSLLYLVWPETRTFWGGLLYALNIRNVVAAYFDWRRSVHLTSF